MSPLEGEGGGEADGLAVFFVGDDEFPALLGHVIDLGETGGDASVEHQETGTDF